MYSNNANLASSNSRIQHQIFIHVEEGEKVISCSHVHILESCEAIEM